MGLFSEGLEELQQENKALRKEIKKLKEENEKLQHEYDTTRGLWCTDKPEVLSDQQKKVFWILK